MQYVRFIKKNHKTELLKATSISINFDNKVVMKWNGIYWEEIPFEEMKIFSTFDAPEDYEE